MLFSRPLSIDSALAVSVTRTRVRSFAASRELSELEAFRRRQIIGWRLSESNENTLFQPEYGEALNIDGARFVGLFEPAVSGSRIRGYIEMSPLTRIAMSVFMLAVIVATTIALAEGRAPATNVLSAAAMILAIAMLTVRYTLRRKSRHVEHRLRRYLGRPERKVAA